MWKIIFNNENNIETATVVPTRGKWPQGNWFLSQAKSTNPSLLS